LKINEIKNLVIKGKTKEAIFLSLKTFESFKDVYNKIAVLSGEFHRYETDKILGIENNISDLNRINLSLLTIIDEGENFLMSAKLPVNSIPTRRKINTGNGNDKKISPIALKKKRLQERKQELLSEMIENKELHKQPHPIRKIVQDKIVQSKEYIKEAIDSLINSALKDFFTVERINPSLKNIKKIFLDVGQSIESPTIRNTFKHVTLGLDEDKINIITRSRMAKELLENERFKIADEICRYTGVYYRIFIEVRRE